MTHRTVPQDIEAERTVLGACIANPGECIPLISVMLTPLHFFDHFHGTVLDTLLGMYSRGETINAFTLAQQIEREGKCDPVIAVRSEVNDLQTFIGIPSVAEDAAKYVLRAADLRRALIVLMGVEEAAYAPQADPTEVVAGAVESLMALSVDRAKSLSADTRQILTGTPDRAGLAAEIMEFLEDGTRIRGIQTGWDWFDNWLHGLEPSSLYTIQADTAVGKSILVHWLMWMLGKQGYRSMLVSTEMSRNQILRRILGMEAQVNFEYMRLAGGATEHEIRRINTALEDLDTNNRFVVCDLGKPYIDLAISEVKRNRRRQQIDVVFVDHIQHVRVKGIPENQATAALEVVTSDLKALAMNEDIPVVQISHINREAARAGYAGLHGAKGSGSIEQDSNAMVEVRAVKWDIHQKAWTPFADEQETKLYHASHRRHPIQFQILKNRDGSEPWTVMIRDWDRGGRFEPPQPEDHP